MIKHAQAPDETDERWFGPEIVKQMISVGTSTLYSWIREGKFPPPFKVGGQNRWHAYDVKRWMRARQEACAKQLTDGRIAAMAAKSLQAKKRGPRSSAR